MLAVCFSSVLRIVRFRFFEILGLASFMVSRGPAFMVDGLALALEIACWGHYSEKSAIRASPDVLR